RLLESREDHFHPGLHARVREQLNRVDMSVEAGLAERDADFARRRRSRHVERADADAGFKNRRRVAAAADADKRIRPFADGAARAGELDSRLDESAVAVVVIYGGAFERLAGFRHGGLVARRAPFFYRLDA